MKLDNKKLLSGRYEVERLPGDFSAERVVPDFAFNILNSKGLLYRPIVDEHYLDSGGKKPSWPNGNSFAVCLTHDVDAVSLHSLRESLRVRWSEMKRNPSLVKKINHMVGLGLDWFTYGGKKDPIHCYEMWLKVEAEVNACSTFFFWPGLHRISKPHPTDCKYALSDTIYFNGEKCSVAEMIKEIDQKNWEIGLHSSWYSFNDPEELKRQKEVLATVVGHDIVSVRQHYLHYDIRLTPHVHLEAGFKYDSTLGFNDNIGFRFGTCYPWNLYDLKNEKEIPVLEIPLIIQDSAMLSPLKGMRLDGETAFKYIEQITETVERVGGVLTLLWHPSRIADPDWWNLYLRTLQYLKEKKAWFGTVKRIGEWWEAQKTKERGVGYYSQD